MKKLLFFVGVLCAAAVCSAQVQAVRSVKPARGTAQEIAKEKRLYLQTVVSLIKNRTKDLKIVDAEGRFNGPDMVKFLAVLREEVSQYKLSDAKRFEAIVSRKAFANACPEEFAKTLKGNGWLSFIRHEKDGFSKTYEMHGLTSIFYNLDPSSPENGYVTVMYADKTRQKFNAKGVSVKE